jgi:hypothetical protein
MAAGKWALVASLAACLPLACRFEADHAGSRYACDDGICPAGFACVDGRCYADESPAVDASPYIDAPPPVDAGPPDATPPPDGPPPPDAALPCVEGEGQVTDPTTGTCYLRFDTPRTWEAARNACQGISARLAEIDGAVENLVVGQLFVAGVTDAWLAGTDAASEGIWRWSSGPVMVYTNWRVPEPNNGGTTQGPENCLVIELDGAGLWDDRKCGSTFGYVCER